jgi:RNA polymerase sigma-70 factor (ECF subfamily)
VHDAGASNERERERESADDAEAARDAQTIARVVAGDREAFGTLVARYARRLHDLARRMLRDPTEAEDAVQQAFLNAFRALDTFDPRRPFRHWLLRITSNLCRNRLVARRHRPEPVGLGAGAADGEFNRAPPEPAAPFDPGSHADDAVDADRVRIALDALPDLYRLTAVLRYVHGLDLAEIASITDDPIPTVKTHLHRARAALRLSLGDLPASPHESTSRSRETRAGRAGTDS